jgi:hypothetical protein
MLHRPGAFQNEPETRKYRAGWQPNKIPRMPYKWFRKESSQKTNKVKFQQRYVKSPHSFLQVPVTEAHNAVRQPPNF